MLDTGKRLKRTLGPILAAGVAALLLNSAASAQRYVFGRADFPTGDVPSAVVTGDFNGDGIPDLAVYNGGGGAPSGGSVSILLGNPDGTFQHRVDYPIGGGVRGQVGPFSSLVSADFNRDGKLDLAVTITTGVSILLGNGDGTFQPHVDYPAYGTQGLVVADFNRDGKLDLALSGGDFVSILLGNGDGTFQAHQDYVTQGSQGIVVGDFNADGKIDIAVTGGSNSGPGVSVLLGNGDGTFQSPAFFSVGGSVAAGVAAADFNGDGKLDLAVANDQGVAILAGNGDGTFQAPVQYKAPGGLNAGLSVVTTDLNGDGKFDLVLVSPTATSVLLGNGDGTFQPSTDYALAGLAFAALPQDVNGDGRIDLVVAHENCLDLPCDTGGSVSILLGNGDGTLTTAKSYGTGSVPFSVATADFNGDGNLDLVVADDTDPGSVSILLGNPDGSFRTHVEFATGPYPFSVTRGDFNGDGKPDLAVANESNGIGGTVSILLGNGDGTFASHVDYTTGVAPFSVTTGDFNGDGKLDLAVANFTDSTVSILLGNGDGTFQTRVDYATAMNPVSLTTADFNGDGKLDLGVGAGVGVSILLGNGDGTFRPHVDYPTGNPTASATGPIVAGDFNGDGKTDLALGNVFSDTVSVLLGNGDGTFLPHVDYAVGAGPASITTLDLNGDGNLDLAVASLGADAVSILVGKGDGTFHPRMDYGAGLPRSVTSGDFNRDGRADLVFANQEFSTVSVLLNLPVVALFPKTLTFGIQAVGTTGSAETFLLSNPSALPLTISNILASGDFAQTNTCPLAPASLPVGADCTVTVTFSPTATGKRSGLISITDNTPTSPQMITLTGVGGVLPPAPSLSAPALNFGYHLVGTPSLPQTVTLTNTSGETVNISGLAPSGGFAANSNCGTSLAPNASCTITATFTPSAAGPISGTITITDNAGTGSQTISVSGIGAPTPTYVFPSNLDFGDQQVGVPSPARTVTLANASNQPLLIRKMLASPHQYAQTNKCGALLVPGAGCSIEVSFTPGATGVKHGFLTILDNGDPKFAIVKLTGDGI